MIWEACDHISKEQIVDIALGHLVRVIHYTDVNINSLEEVGDDVDDLE